MSSTGHIAPRASQAALELIRADLLQSGYTVDDQTLTSAQRFINGQLSWHEFLSQASFDNLPAEAWSEWAK
ncbi:hypothetical protein [Pseudomonas sp. NPDC089569]|uniref:hypothetical protein n=1 Tax=Pseudomonas sp. NPDC089569 TaxID=3390722 RepID=UPI003D055D42